MTTPDEALRPGDVATLPDADAARKYWIEHARATTGTAAVHPGGRWMGYHAWTRRMLQQWTLQRVAADRRRYTRCVDLGCGPGDWSALFAPLSDEIHACDVSPDFVARTRASLSDHASAHVEINDIRGYPIPLGADLVFLGGVLTYVGDEDALDVLRRVRAAAAPGAHVIIRDYCAINLGRRTVNSSTGYSVHRRASELRTLGTQAGLSCIEVRASPSIYGELWGRSTPMSLPLRALWRLATAHWLRASYTLRFRA